MGRLRAVRASPAVGHERVHTQGSVAITDALFIALNAAKVLLAVLRIGLDEGPVGTGVRPASARNSERRPVLRGCRLPTLVPSWVPLFTLYYRPLPCRERNSLTFLTPLAIS